MSPADLYPARKNGGNMAFIPKDDRLDQPASKHVEPGDILVLRDELHMTQGIFTPGHRFFLAWKNKVSETYSVFLLVDIEGRKIILDQEELDELDPAVIKTYPYADIRRAG